MPIWCVAKDAAQRLEGDAYFLGVGWFSGPSRDDVIAGTSKRQIIGHFLRVSLPTTVARSRSASGAYFLANHASISARCEGLGQRDRPPNDALA